MQKFFFNDWTDDGISEFCGNHIRDNHRKNYQDEDDDGGYRLRFHDGDSFEIRYWQTSHGTNITVIWINNKLARLVVREWE